MRPCQGPARHNAPADAPRDAAAERAI